MVGHAAAWMLVPADRGRDGGDDRLRLQRLAQERRGAEFRRAVQMAGIRDAGHQDDLWRIRQRPQLAADFEAIHLRHDQIEQHDIGAMKGRGIERLPARGRDDDGVVFVLEPGSDQANEEMERALGNTEVPGGGGGEADSPYEFLDRS